MSNLKFKFKVKFGLKFELDLKLAPSNLLTIKTAV